MSMIRKLTGTLALGPVRHNKGAEIVYNYIRVGDAFIKKVKIPGVLDSLLRNGRSCTLWVATIRTPTPFLFKTEIHVVYAVAVDGVIHKAIEEVRRGWTGGKWLGVLALLGVGAATILLYIGLLFWINAIRLSFVELPLDEMRGEPA